MTKVEGYCLKCKKKSEMHNVKEVTMKNGRKAAKGTCSCGTNMFKILPGSSSSKKSASTSSKSKSKKKSKSKSKKGGKSKSKKTKSKRKTKSRRKSKKA